jgi:hypothetical protein
MSEHPTAVDALYLDAEHFALIAESQPPLEPREHVKPVGCPFPGLFPHAGLARPGEEPTT